MPYLGALQRSSTAQLTIVNTAPSELPLTTLLINDRARIIDAEPNTVPANPPGGNGSVEAFPILVGNQTARVVVLISPPPGGSGTLLVNGDNPLSFDSDIQLTFNTVG